MKSTVRIFKIFTGEQWDTLHRDGIFEGSADDLRDGYIHMSAEPQLKATLTKHFAGRLGLVIAEIATERLGAALKWETSRDGALFPHLYGKLELADVISGDVIKNP